MKTFIIQSRRDSGEQGENIRFRTMIAALNNGGVFGKYLPVSNSEQLLTAIKLERPDICFSTSYYVDDEKGNKVNIHQVLEDNGISYIGSSAKVLELVISKYLLKAVWKTLHIATPEFFLASNSIPSSKLAELIGSQNQYPYLLKPNMEGNSRGLDETSIVFDQNTFNKKLNELLSQYNEVLVEKYLGTTSDMREFTVAMIGNGRGRYLMPAEIILKEKRKLRIVTTIDKDNHGTIAKPIHDPILKYQVTDFAAKAFLAAGVRDYARCDIIRADGELYAIEINGQPMMPDKWFQVCSSSEGFESTQYINAVFLAGILRNQKTNNSELTFPTNMRMILPENVIEKLGTI